MIQDLNAVNVSGFKQIVDNVWRVTINGNRYAIKAEKQIPHAHSSDPNATYSGKWNNMAWACELFSKVMADSSVPVAARALYRGEAAPMYIELPGASSLGSSDEWASRLFQIADWCDGVQSFMDAKQDAAMKKKLAKVLEKKEAMQELGKGMAVDLFLGNRDRFSLTLDPEFGDDWFLNVDNFFFLPDKGKIVFMDFWDPNSNLNYRTRFNNDDSYLGQYLKTKSGRENLADRLLGLMSRRLELDISNRKYLISGFELGQRALGKALASSESSAVRSRMSACGI